LTVAWCDELSFGFGWIVPEPRIMERASHALLADTGVWLVDPVEGEGVDGRVLALGKPVGVIQLLDRHERDCASLAARFGVPLFRVPFEGVPGSPFEVLRVVDRFRWREAALWWPEEAVLVCADALGTARYFRAPGEALGVHPLLRLTPPWPLRTRPASDPGHVVCGHGAGIHGDGAPLALDEALATARSRIPRYLTGLVRGRR
jgi:hypothetical protein